MNEFVALRCPMPDCRADLQLVMSIGRPLFTSDLEQARDIDATEAWTATWQVECDEGHVVQLPGYIGCGHDDACACDPDNFDSSDDHRTFRGHDATRLGELLTLLDHEGPRS